MNTGKSVVFGWVVLSGAALSAYIFAKKCIHERRLEEGRKQLEERQREHEANQSSKDPLSESMPIHLSFDERLQWLEDKMGGEGAKKKDN